MRSWALCVLTLQLRAAGGQEQGAECCVESAACPGNCSAGFGWERESGGCERCAAGKFSPGDAPCSWCPHSLVPNAERNLGRCDANEFRWVQGLPAQQHANAFPAGLGSAR